jgi:hypothetical protein
MVIIQRTLSNREQPGQFPGRGKAQAHLLLAVRAGRFCDGSALVVVFGEAVKFQVVYRVVTMEKQKSGRIKI